MFRPPPKKLHTTQPGISNQIRLLEEEGNVHIFERGAKRLTGLTSPGKAVLAIDERILRDMENARSGGLPLLWRGTHKKRGLEEAPLVMVFQSTLLQVNPRFPTQSRPWRYH